MNPDAAWVAFFEEALRLAAVVRERREATEKEKAPAGQAEATTGKTNNENSTQEITSSQDS